MGLQQSKDELLYQQVGYGNSEGIKSLRNEGAGLEVCLKFDSSCKIRGFWFEFNSFRVQFEGHLSQFKLSSSPLRPL